MGTDTDTDTHDTHPGNKFRRRQKMHFHFFSVTSQRYTGGTVIEDEEEEITGKATAALWGYATLPTNALKCGLVDYKWRHRGDFRIFISSKRN